MRLPSLSRPSRNVTGVDCQATRSVFLSRKDVCRGDKPLIILHVPNRYGSRLRAKATQVSVICQMYRITSCKWGQLYSFVSHVNCEKKNAEKFSVSNSCQTMLIPEDNVIGYDINILKFEEFRHKYFLQWKTEFQ
jgi:hypothetical protein